MKITHILLPIFLFTLLACSSEPKTTDENVQTEEEAVVQEVQEEEVISEAVETEPILEVEPVEELSTDEWYAKLDEEIEEEFQKLLKKDKPSIMDYYLALPYERVFDWDCEEPKYMTMEKRRNQVKYQNIPSGYLLTGRSSSPPPSSEDRVFVLFRSSANGKDYIGSLRGSQCGDFFCGASEGFITLSNSGEWIDVDDELFGKDLLTKKMWEERGRNYSLVLPEKGTSISIVKCVSIDEDEQDVDLGQLIWKQTHFTTELNDAGKAFLRVLIRDVIF